MTVPLLEILDITKSFGALKANDHVSLKLGEGEIVALLGENGAGKSSLVKMLFGALQPDSGTILWRDKETAIPDPAAARALGISMVHQHFSLFEAFTVEENIALGLPDMPRAGLADKARELSAAYGLPLDPTALVADLSVGERQRIEIVRCLLQNPTLVIMDEPTSVLTPQEVERLFGTLRQLKAEGRTVVYISHKLEEVRDLCERAVILRHGRVVETCDPRERSAAELASAMVGGAIADVARGGGTPGAAILAVRDLDQASAGTFGTALQGIELEVRAGEVVGIAGIAGNGQGELFAILSGETLANRADAITIDGEPVGRLGIDARRRRGAAFVPEERLGHGAVPAFDLADNALVSRHRPADGTAGPAGVLRHGMARRLAARVIRAMDVRTPGTHATAGSLSGGNLQKFVVGRELDARPKLLVVDQPTWGVDAGASANIRQALIDLAAAGAAVLVVSQDLDELFEIADRIAVICAGRLSPARPAGALTREAIGLLMAGAAPRSDAGAEVSHAH
ncbi:ABC transporter ATP-binding protein [Acuticoccus sp. I52.16.1]|uniref:ABC transporter ATP-binding protein n=1 Tax=Acuticoccus sp. I52.16.1 TaxID=2928472 RepID=UPI001FD134D2|nr:ABC transporter ATP-binding protein [Acuticoccus sp. I52.16.1]UOM33146.1 ABC transporter ATP-binding protein [Acuticoccus sp. I52.16.1]